MEEAYRLNAPPRARLLRPGQAGALPPERIYFETDREGVYVEAVKRAEDEDAVVVRIYDAMNRRGPVRLMTSLPVRSAHLCDLLERDLEELPLAPGAVEIYLKPFEIVTVKLRLDESTP